MTESTDRNGRVWSLAVWFGMIMGLGEAAIFLAWQLAGDSMYVTVDIVWAAVLYDTLLCLLAGGAVAVAGRFVPAVRAKLPLVLAFVLFVSWTAVALHDRIYTWVFPIVAGGLAITLTRSLQREGRLDRLVGATLVPLTIVAVGASLAVPTARYLGLRRAVAALPAAGATAPNVMILLIDTFRADHSSAYGYERPTTPRIDALAAEGVLFERAFATSSYTLASHASLITGLFPHEHGAQWDEPLRFNDCDCPTLGGALQERGYVTAGFSSNPFWFTREHGFGQGFLVFDDYFHSPLDAFIRTAYGRAFEQVALPRLGFLDIPARKQAAEVNERVLRWIDDRNDRPFFTFVNYFDIHDPYLPPEPYRSRFAGKPVGGVVNWRLNGLDPQLEASVIQDERDAYDGAITYVDEQVGLLLDALDERGALDNTIVIVTSDHGEEFGEHGHMLHGHSLYRQSVHVPLVVWNPERVPGGLRVAEPVTNAALPSTIMDLLGGDRSVFPLGSLLSDPFDAPGTAPALAGLVMKPWGPESFPTFHGAMESIVDGRWHYVRHEVFGPELYDLDSDFEEQQNLAEDPGHAALVDSLDGRIDALWAPGER
jgi:arylsulfatase A-like enzyme